MRLQEPPDNGIFEIGDTLLGQTQFFLTTLALVVAIAFFIIIAIRTRFAWAPMLLAAAAASFVVWVVINVESGRQIIDDTIDAPEPEENSAPGELPLTDVITRA